MAKTKEDELLEQIAIRPYLKNTYGVNDANIGWKNGQVQLNGQNLIKPSTIKDGASFTSENKLRDAMSAYSKQTGFKLPNNTLPATEQIYTNQNQGQTDALVDKILEFKEFSYDAANDPLYQTALASAQKSGNKSFDDNLAGLSGATMGRPNSWAASVASQSRDNAMENFNADIMPQLAELAYSKYKDQFSTMIDQFSVLANQDTKDYSRFTDQRNFDYGSERDAIGDERYEDETEYNRNYIKNRDFKEDQRYEDETSYNRNYTKSRDSIEDQKYEDELNYQRDLNNKNTGNSGNDSVDNSDVASYSSAEIKNYKDMDEQFSTSNKYKDNPEAVVQWLTSLTGEKLVKEYLGNDDLYNRMLSKYKLMAETKTNQNSTVGTSMKYSDVSGVLDREFAYGDYVGMQDEVPSDNEKIQRILDMQLTDELTWDMFRRYKLENLAEKLLSE